MSELDVAIEALKSAPTVKIGKKEYTTVATRVEVFRRHFGLEYSLTTEVIDITDPFVRVRAIISRDGNVVATGMAEENRQQGQVNRTSALENCETSAVGRALAAFGLHGGEYASAGEIEDAIAKQDAGDKEFVKTNLKARSHEIVRELHACTEMDMLTALWGSKEIQDTVKRMKSHYVEGYDSIMETKEKMKDELTAVEERAGLQDASGEPLGVGDAG